jgi:hypothetical protein
LSTSACAIGTKTMMPTPVAENAMPMARDRRPWNQRESIADAGTIPVIATPTPTAPPIRT